MEHIDIDALVAAHGFAGAYYLEPLPLETVWAAQYCARPKHTEALCLDPKAAYPRANSIVLLVQAYVPFRPETGLPGYYIASNWGYHAANALVSELRKQGHMAERLEVPLSALVTQAGIGRLLKNALIDIPPYGTRTALFTFVSDILPRTYNAPPPPACHACDICAKACPMGAISTDTGLCAPRCIRTHMEKEPPAAQFIPLLPGLLGCELCQAACPRNAHIGTREASEHERAAFDLHRLLAGDIADAKALVGKNMCTGGRLTAHAAALLARSGYMPDEETCAALHAHASPLVRAFASTLFE
ncbi:hypothetical protein LJC07_03905 [Christensenellaceae bacterium OttesenSCG-928-L17]|nr:hypothetical protein [Christensenellaceae bacterium OttesenSCG-928-L17]